jgi:hypothetical protein
MFTVLLLPGMQYLEAQDRFGEDLEGIVPPLSFYEVGNGLALRLPQLPRFLPVSSQDPANT